MLPKLQAESSALSRVHKAWKCAKMVSAWTAWLNVQASGPTVKPCKIRIYTRFWSLQGYEVMTTYKDIIL